MTARKQWLLNQLNGKIRRAKRNPTAGYSPEQIESVKARLSEPEFTEAILENVNQPDSWIAIVLSDDPAVTIASTVGFEFWGPFYTALTGLRP